MSAESKSECRVQQRRKLALVVGIENYATGNVLKHAINDACDIAAELTRIGFLVVGGPQLDLTCEKMELVLTDFKHLIEEEDIVVFYYTGHGVQWEVCISGVLRARFSL